MAVKVLTAELCLSAKGNFIKYLDSLPLHLLSPETRHDLKSVIPRVHAENLQAWLSKPFLSEQSSVVRHHVRAAMIAHALALDDEMLNAWSGGVPEVIHATYAEAVGLLLAEMPAAPSKQEPPKPTLVPIPRQITVHRRRSPAYTRRLERRRALRDIGAATQKMVEEVAGLTQLSFAEHAVSKKRLLASADALLHQLQSVVKDVKRMRIRDTRQVPRPARRPPIDNTLRELHPEAFPATPVTEVYVPSEPVATGSHPNYQPDPVRSSNAVHSAMLRFGEPRGDDGDYDSDDNFYDAE